METHDADSTIRPFSGKDLAMWERIQKLIDRIESRLALYLAIGGSSVMGVITGWLSSGVEWINQFGAFGWWVSGLVGFILTMLGRLGLRGPDTLGYAPEPATSGLNRLTLSTHWMTVSIESD